MCYWRGDEPSAALSRMTDRLFVQHSTILGVAPMRLRLSVLGAALLTAGLAACGGGAETPSQPVAPAANQAMDHATGHGRGTGPATNQAQRQVQRAVGSGVSVKVSE